MKPVAGIGLLGFLVILLIAMLMWSGGGDKESVALFMAFGNPADGKIEMHVVADTIMFSRDRGKDTGHEMNQPEWIEAHVIIEDATGHRVPIEYTNNSSVVRKSEVMASLEFFMVAKLTTGEEYTLTYIPDRAEPRKCRYQFKAPAEPKKLHQEILEPVE